MPRYHFNVRRAAGTVYDLEGVELATLALARDEAILDARSAMSEAIRSGRDISHSVAIDICDEDGRLLATLPYYAAIMTDDEGDVHGASPNAALFA